MMALAEEFSLLVIAVSDTALVAFVRLKWSFGMTQKMAPLSDLPCA